MPYTNCFGKTKILIYIYVFVYKYMYVYICKHAYLFKNAFVCLHRCPLSVNKAYIFNKNVQIKYK